MIYIIAILLTALLVELFWGYRSDVERDDYKHALERMRFDRDSLQKEVDYLRKIVHMRADQ